MTDGCTFTPTCSAAEQESSTPDDVTNVGDVDYKTWTCKQLRDECRRRDLRGFSRLRRDELVELLTSDDAGTSDSSSAEQCRRLIGSATIKSPLKWVGGKAQLLPMLVPILEHYLQQVDNYCEPLLGGGSVLLSVLTNGFQGRVVVNDANEQLINFYRQVQSNPTQLADSINEAIKYYNETPEDRALYYYEIRDLFNQHLQELDVEQAARFYLLNRSCFRGLYRISRNGFNVPFGNYKRLTPVNFINLSRRLQSVEFYSLDYVDFYEQVVKALPGRTLVYYDPPYVPVNQTSFVDYTTNGFNHLRFLNHVLDAINDGMGVVMTNSDSSLVRDFVAKHNLFAYRVECRRRINSGDPAAVAMEYIVAS